MKKLKILVDMDEITVNLIDEWLRTYNQEWDDNLTREKVKGWDVHNYVKPECGKNIYRILQRPGLFDYLPANPGAVDSITFLNEAGHDIRFATAAPSADSCRGKVEWVRRHFKHLDFGISRLLFLHEKTWLAPAVDVLIDDKPQTIKDWRLYSDQLSHGPSIFTIAHPHNEVGREYAHYVAHDYRNMKTAWSGLVNQIQHLSETLK